MNNFCCNPKTRYFIRRERIPIYFLSPLCTFCTPFYRTFRFFNRLSLLYLSTSTSPYTSLYLHEYHSFMVLYYIFFLFPLNPRQTVRLHFAFIPFLFLSYVYIYICSTEIHRNPTKKQFHPYLLGIPLAKNMFFIPKDTYYKPWRAIIFSHPLSSSNTILFILESSRFIRTRDFHDYVRTKEKRISVKF